MSARRRAVVLGPFKLLAPVASGATAVIWQAVHRARRVPVAVKVMSPPPARRQARMERLFAHEARAVARLDHRGIVRLFDFGVLPELGDERLPAGAPYLVMEWIDGGTLERSVGKLAWPVLRATLLALLDALAHAHARGVIHQDIKVANVLMSRRGPVLSDFGIAFSPDHAPDEPPRLLGTPDYMAPEQVEMQRHAVGPWSDLYGLGCVAYALASGLPPFAGRSLSAVFAAHVREAVPTLAPLVDVPAGFVGWVHRLLEKAPEARFRFAADAAAALAGLGEAGAVGAETSSAEAPPLPLPGTGRALFALRETALSGREVEQAVLWRALGEAIDGPAARLVFIDGLSGLGKSHLARWLARRAHEGGRADFLWASHSEGSNAGHGIGAMFNRHLRAADFDGVPLHRQLSAALGDRELAAEVAAALAPDRRFVGPAGVVALGSPRERHEVLCRALARLCADRPRVMLLDDVQWGDEALRFVEHLLENHPTLPVLVVATVRADRARPAVRARIEGLAARPVTTRLMLGPLAPEALARTLRLRLPLAPGVVERVVAQAGGSLVFADELVRHWLRTEALVERAGALRLRRGAGVLPDGMRAVWRARLDAAVAGLDGAARAALWAAACLGEPVDPALWAAVAEVPAGLLDLAREHLLDARLAIGESSGSWRFAHPLVRSALLDAAREADAVRVIHRRCAAALCDRGADARRIAGHHLGAGDAVAAVPLLFEVARRRPLVDHHARRRDLIHLAGALRSGRHRLDGPAWTELRVHWAEACQIDDDVRRARRHATRALRQAERLGDARLLGWSQLTVAHLWVREIDVIEQWLRPACAAADRSDDATLAWLTHYAFVFCLAQASRFDEAEAALARLFALLTHEPDARKRGDALFVMTMIARGRGRLEEAEVTVRASVAQYIASGSRIKQSQGLNLAGDIARYQGRLSEAADAYREAARLAHLVGSYDALTDDLNLGLVLNEMGDNLEARRCLTTVLRRAEEAAFGIGVTFAQLALLVCEARDGRWAAWDLRFEQLEAMRDGRLVDPDIPRCAALAADIAAAAGQHRRARDARLLAAAQLDALGQRDEAAALRALQAGQSPP